MVKLDFTPNTKTTQKKGLATFTVYRTTSQGPKVEQRKTPLKVSTKKKNFINIQGDKVLQFSPESL